MVIDAVLGEVVTTGRLQPLRGESCRSLAIADAVAV